MELLEQPVPGLAYLSSAMSQSGRLTVESGRKSGCSLVGYALNDCVGRHHTLYLCAVAKSHCLCSATTAPIAEQVPSDLLLDQQGLVPARRLPGNRHTFGLVCG